MSAGGLPSWELVVLVFGVAFLYSSVGFGGASGYLAAMSLFVLPVDLMASTALVLNIVVAGVAFFAYWQAGHFAPQLLLPLLLTSVPAAFLGGYIEVQEAVYRTLLYLALGYVGVRMIAFNDLRPRMDGAARRIWPWMLASGVAIGLISGLLGLGGGIFLSPLIILAGWGTPKQAAATSAGFIVANSISGVLGRVVGGNFVFGLFGMALLPVGLIGGMAGSRLGARHLSGTTLRRVLGVLLLLVVLRYFFS